MCWELCGKEGGGHGRSDTGLQVSLVVSSSVVYIREFGPLSVPRGILKVSETSPFGLLTCRPLTSLVSQLNHELCRSEGVVSLSSFGLHGCVFLSEVCSETVQGRCCYSWFNTVWLLFVFITRLGCLVLLQLPRDGCTASVVLVLLNLCNARLSCCLSPAVPHV